MSEEFNDELERVRKVIKHIQNVQQNCIFLGEKLIEKGEPKLGRQIIANGFLHDNSKLIGEEFNNLTGAPEPKASDTKALKFSINHHNQGNRHHPEYWDKGIHSMDKASIAEMVCDWKARSSEKGTSLKEWIDKEATKRFDFNKRDLIYTQIMEFVDMLCDPPFKPV